MNVFSGDAEFLLALFHILVSADVLPSATETVVHFVQRKCKDACLQNVSNKV